MNNLNKVDGEGYKDYNQPPKEEGLINKTLPLEIFEKVLSYLDDMDMQQAVLVSRLWSTASIDTAKQEEFSMIKGFVNFLSKNLQKESYASQREQLFGIGSDRKILHSVNLIQVKSSIHWLKENVLNILKGLEEKDLKSLEDLSKNKTKPKFFENVFDLARIYKKIDEANQIPDDMLKTSTLQDISRALLKSGNVEKAIEIANTIPSEGFKSSTLKDISRALLKSGNVEKAIEIANTIPEGFKSSTLQDISRALLKSGNVEKAIEIANTIPSEGFKSSTLQDISRALLKSGNVEKAIEIANTIPSEGFKSSTLQDIKKFKL